MKARFHPIARRIGHSVRNSLLSLLLLQVAVAWPQKPTPAQVRERTLVGFKQDYRLFFGLDDPVTDSGNQSVRRMDFLDGLVDAIVHYPRIDVSDPTAGRLGAVQHATAALFALTDLGTLLRTKCPPRDLEGNYYAHVATRYEEALRDRILEAPEQARPGDVMRMALDVAGGNYTLATLTAHNLLKNVAYIGRQADEIIAERHQKDPNYEREQLQLQPKDKYVVLVAAKLLNLRANPAVREKMGPWYHIFGILFVGSTTNGIFSEGLATAEHFTRELRFGSDPDLEKTLWDFIAYSTMERVHPVLYGNGTLVVNAYDPFLERSVPWAKVKAQPEAGQAPAVEFDAGATQLLAPGRYTIRVTTERDPDYAPGEKQGVEVKAGERNDLRVDLISKYGYIQATAVEMSGGDPIWGENTYVGYTDASGMAGGMLPTPHTFKVPAGQYRVFAGNVDKVYTREEVGPVAVTPGKLIAVEIPLRSIPKSDAKTGSLIVFVKTSVRQSELSLDSKATVTISAEANGSRKIINNVHPSENVEIPAGRYSVEAACQGYEPASKEEVEVEAGKLAEVFLYLKAESGTLNVNVVDARNGWTLPGMKVTVRRADISVSDVAPCTFTLTPDAYDIFVAGGTVNGQEYREKTIAGVQVSRNQTNPLVVVMEPAEVPVAQPPAPATPSAATLAIEPEFLDLDLGETGLLTARILDSAGRVIPGASVTWTAANPSVAGVDASGKVTAHAGGKAAVRAEYRGLTATVPVTVAEAPPLQVLLEAERTSITDGDSVRITARVPNRDANFLQLRWSASSGMIAGAETGADLSAAGVNPTAGALPVSVVVKVVVSDGFGFTASAQTVITVNARKKLRAELTCGASLELVPGEIDRTCRLAVRGWRGNTTDRVEVVFPQLQEDGESLPGDIVVFPGNPSADPGNMFTAGITDQDNGYEFSLRFSARSGAAPGSWPVRILVRQRGAEEVRLNLTVNVLASGQIAVPGMGNAPPPRQGSGGNTCVWRYKLLSETEAGCWHFVAAQCGTARYDNPSNGYVLAGTNMTTREAEDLITEQGRYFSPCEGASRDAAGGLGNAASSCMDWAIQFRQLLSACDTAKARQIANRYYEARCDSSPAASGSVAPDLRKLLSDREAEIREAEDLLVKANDAQRLSQYDKALELAGQAQGVAPDCMRDKIRDSISRLQQARVDGLAREDAALRDELAEWEKGLACLEEGKRKSPSYELDCNGNWTLGNRDAAIEKLRRQIADARSRLGLPPGNSPPSGAGPRTANPDTRPAGANPPQPGTTGARPDSRGSETAATALLVLQFLYFYGEELWFTPPSGTERRLSNQDSFSPGSTVRTGKESRVTLGSQGGSTITIDPNSNVKIPHETTEKGRTIELSRGGVEVKHPEGAPSFDDVIIRSPEGRITPAGTRYRVQVDTNGTTVEVFEGQVHLSGAYIIRLAAPGQDAGKQSPRTELDLHAGQRALMARGSQPGKDSGSDLPAWMRPRDPASSPPASSLYPAEPWNDARIQGLMDRWISSAIPPTSTPGIVMHYNEWLQPLSQAATSTGPPDHPPDWTRYRYVWENRNRYPSSNLCTLGEFVDRSLRGEGTDGCSKALPSWMTSPNPAPPRAAGVPAGSAVQAIDKARAQLAREQEERIRQAQPRSAQQQPLPPSRADTAPPAAPPPNLPARQPAGNAAPVDFSGNWICRFRISDLNRGSGGDVPGLRPGTESTSRFAIRRNGPGYVINDGTSSISSSYVEGNRIGFHSAANSASGQSLFEMVTTDVELQLKGGLLSGSGAATGGNGFKVTFTLTCSPEINDKKK